MLLFPVEQTNIRLKKEKGGMIMANLHTKEQIIALRNRTARPERENAYWSSGECEFLRTMYHDGTGITDIAILLQRSETAIMKQILKLDLPDRQAYPIRRKKNPKYYCLCERCRLPEGECPRCGAGT